MWWLLFWRGHPAQQFVQHEIRSRLLTVIFYENNMTLVGCTVNTNTTCSSVMFLDSNLTKIVMNINQLNATQIQELLWYFILIYYERHENNSIFYPPQATLASCSSLLLHVLTSMYSIQYFHGETEWGLKKIPLKIIFVYFPCVSQSRVRASTVPWENIMIWFCSYF